MPGKTVADVEQFNNTDDTAFIERLYAAGLRRAGDVSAAAVINSGPLYLANFGPFDSTRIAESYGSLRIPLQSAARLDQTDIARWLVP